MTHILKLLSGDRGNPTSELDLNQLTAGEIRLTSGGLVPNPGQLNVLYTGESIRYNGELPVKESRGNMRLELRYNIKGGSSADVSRIQREITQFLRDAKLYNQDGQGEAVWLEYRWNTSQALDDLPRPTWGQLNYYAEILSADDVRWPDNIHEQGYLSGNFVEGVICTLTCKPHWYGLEQRAVTTPGLMDVTDQYNTTLSGVDFSGEWSISCWFENTDGLAASNYALKYYVDANNDFRVYQSTSGNVVLYRKVGGTATTVALAGNTSAPNHFSIVQSASTITLYVNGVAAGSTVASSAWGSGTLFVGCADATGASNAETTATLDGFRIWENEELTAAQVAALYTEEKAIKDAGGWVGKPPYLYTYNATNKVYRGNSTTSGGYNCAIVGNVNGSGVDALARYLVDVPATRLWFGRYALNNGATISGIGMGDNATSGATANNDSHGNSYQTDSWLAAAGDSTEFVSSFSDIYDYLEDGKYLILSRVKSDGDDCTVKLGYKYSSGDYESYLDAVTVTDGTNWTIQKLGTMDVRRTNGLLQVYTTFEQISGSAAVDVYFDFVQFLPYPYIEIETDSNKYSYDLDGEIYKNSLNSGISIRANVIGPSDGVTLEPGKQNMLMFQFTDSGSADVNGDYITLTTTVIPRWTLPGGLVA